MNLKLKFRAKYVVIGKSEYNSGCWKLSERLLELEENWFRERFVTPKRLAGGKGDRNELVTRIETIMCSSFSCVLEGACKSGRLGERFAN